MVSVIIPALNEAATIRQVVRFCRAHPPVTEVIVVDDNSEDETAGIARDEGAIVIASAARGKGISMREGIAAASNELIVFLDADIDPYPEKTIALLTEPLLSGRADFVKGAFARNAGRVTLLVAKPLLNIFFPGLSHFSQPLSGMIAGKKTFFSKIQFFNDYGVDIGILIDMYLMKARVDEVHIGYLENKSKPWESLGTMSREVSAAIISRARGREPQWSADQVSTVEEIQGEMNKVLRENLSSLHRMLLLDQDQTILKERFIDACALRFGFVPQLEELRFGEKDPIILTKRIGQLLKNRTMDELLDVISGMELADHIAGVVAAFKQKGYRVGIVSHSYTLVANYVKQQIGADFVLAHQLEFFEGRATGEVNLPHYFFGSPDSLCGHAFCKTNALQYACDQHRVLPRNCIAVGDHRDDLCMVAHAGKGVAFCTRDPLLEKIAGKNIRQRDFRPLLDLA